MAIRKAFTLIEMVVVILILGILAGVAAPKFLNTSGQATDNGLKETVKLVRDAVDLYSNDHTGNLPPCTGDGADFRTAMATYIRGDFPTSPVGAKNNLISPTSGASTAGDNSDSTGWKFNTTTGAFICNCSDASPTSGTPYDQF